MNSFLDSETLRERKRREGRIQNGLPRSKFRAKLALFSAGAKGVESGVKGRQIRRPFQLRL